MIIIPIQRKILQFGTSHLCNTAQVDFLQFCTHACKNRPHVCKYIHKLISVLVEFDTIRQSRISTLLLQFCACNRHDQTMTRSQRGLIYNLQRHVHSKFPFDRMTILMLHNYDINVTRIISVT